MITLQAQQKGQGGGGLWFIIPDELQPYVAPWIKSMIPNISNVSLRKIYRSRCTKEAISPKEKYSANIHAKSTIGHSYFRLYTSYGKWRVGQGDEFRAMYVKDVEEDILRALREYAEVVNTPNRQIEVDSLPS